MAEPLKKVFETMGQMKEATQAVLPGASLSKFFSEGLEMLKDKAREGAGEMANAIFQGQAYLPSNHGKPTANNDKDKNKEEEQEQEREKEQERGGR